MEPFCGRTRASKLHLEITTPHSPALCPMTIKTENSPMENQPPWISHPHDGFRRCLLAVMFRSVLLPSLALITSGPLSAQTLATLGSSTPSPGPDDISQLTTSGNTTWPDGLNYFTDNNPPVGQTFTTGSNPMRLVSVAIKTAGLNSGNGYGSPVSTPTYYLRLYSMNGSTATPLITFSAPNPGFTDGQWLRWSGIRVHLEAGKTYAFSFGTQPTGGGWAAMAVATNAIGGGEIALVPVNGGTVTTGGSHNFDAVFSLGLETPASVPDTIPLPTPTCGWNLGNTLESTWGYPFPNQKPFYRAAQAGFNAVRIPCAWDFNADDTTYQIDPAYMVRVKQAVDWSIAAGMHVVINIHWDGGWMENHIGEAVDPVINAKLHSYWTQIATTFAGYGNHLLFAGANEPNVHNPAEFSTLMAYYQTFINAVRGVGGNNTNRWLVLQGGGDTSWFTTLPPDPTPGRLMVEYHNYTPSLFTIIHTDQSWGNAIYFWGKAYHYAGNPGRNAAWPEEGHIDSGFQQLKEQYVDKGIPVLVGEFQAAPTPSLTGTEATYNNASRLYWNKYLVDSAHTHGLSPFYWSTPGSPFDYDTGEIMDQDVVNVLTGGVAPPPPNGAPHAVTGLVATAGSGQVSLSWNAVAGATSYDIYRTAQSGYEPATPSVTGITGTSYVDTGLNGGTTYYYQVVAVNASGPSGFSPEVHATTPGINPDSSQFHFETDTQRWMVSGSQTSGIATSSTQHHAGNRSLAVSFNGTTAGTSVVDVGDVAIPAGTMVTLRLWIPAGSQITAVEPYLQDYNWAWTSGWYGNLAANNWSTLTLTVPANATTPLKRLGVRLTTNAAWSGTCYIDSVGWPVVNTPPVLAAIGSTTVNVGQTVAFTAGATDTDQPPQALTFTLLAGPANATLDANSGSFSFRPLVTHAGSIQAFTLGVSDNGAPPLIDTRSFSVTVNPLVTPTIRNITFAGGQFAFQINGQAGPDYAVETSTDLVEWKNVFTANSPAMPFIWTDTGTSGSTRQFYRVKLGAPLVPE